MKHTLFAINNFPKSFIKNESTDSCITIDCCNHEVCYDSVVEISCDSLLVNNTQIDREFYLLPDNTSLWITVGVPIFSVVLAVVLPLIVSQIAAFFKRKSTRKRWFAELFRLSHSIVNQMSANELAIENLKKDTFSIDIPTRSLALEGRIFNSIDSGELYDFLKFKIKDDKESVKQLDKTLSFIDILRDTAEIQLNKSQRFLDKTSEGYDYFNKGFSQLNRALARYQVHLEKLIGEEKAKNHESFKKIVHLMDEYIKGEGRSFDIELINNQFIPKMLNVLSSERNDEGINEMLQLLSFMIDGIEKIKVERYYLKASLENINSKLESLKQELNYLIDFYAMS